MTVHLKFDDLSEEVLAALRAGARRRLFSSREWFDNYIATVVGDATALRILEAGSPSSPVVLPLVAEGRVLGPLANFYTTHFDLLSGPANEIDSAALESLADDISSASPRWRSLNISPVEAGSEWLSGFTQALSSRGWMTQGYHSCRNLYLENSFDDFAGYLKTRSSRIRKTAANRMRKFDRDENNSFRIYTRPEELEANLPVFDKLYESRWHRTEPYPDFLPGLARVCAENGWLRLGLGFVGDQPAAAQFWIVRDNVAYIYKVAYEEQFTNLSVGAVALFKMFEYVLDEDRVELVDFLTGDEGYKRDWMDQSRDMVGLAAFNRRTLSGLFGGVANVYGGAVKRRLRRANDSS